MMQNDEWTIIEGVLEECWPGEWTARTGPSYRLMLDGYEARDVVTALRKYAAKGSRFRPSASELVQLILEDPRQPTFDEAFAVIFAPDGPLRKRTTEGAAQEAMLHHPLIGRFVQTRGRDALAYLEIDDPEYGGAKRHELRQAWDRMVEAMEGRDVAALVAGAGEERGRLERFDPMRTVGSARGQLGSGERAA